MQTEQPQQINVSVGIDPVIAGHSVPEPDWLAAAVRRGLARVLEPDAEGQVSLLITDDATVRDLNREYRGLDETTDVLSFSAQHSGHWEGDAPEPDIPGPETPADWPLAPDEPPPLGDIVISLPQAMRQAEQQGTPLCRELALLLVHGALHLMGHDHYEPAEQDEMQRLEQIALREIFEPPEA